MALMVVAQAVWTIHAVLKDREFASCRVEMMQAGATSQAVSANHGRARPPIQYFFVLVMVNLMWAFQFSGIPRCQPCDETITRFWHVSTSGKNPRT
jgi:hypothetical protein